MTAREHPECVSVFSGYVLWFVVVAYDVSIELASHTKNSPEDV